MSLLQKFPDKIITAIADKRYVNKYHYGHYWKKWDLILDCGMVDRISYWTVVEVDSFDGRPLGRARNHTIDLEANCFADRPFDVDELDQPSRYEWFRKLVGYRTVKETVSLYDAYLQRLSYCSSYEALVRIGIRDAVPIIGLQDILRVVP